MIYLCAKCDHSTFSRSGDMIGAHQNLNRSRHLTTPLSEIIFVICGLEIATINLSNKFEVSNSSHYEDMRIFISPSMAAR